MSYAVFCLKKKKEMSRLRFVSLGCALSRLRFAAFGCALSRFLFFFFNDTATTEIYTLSLHDALPITRQQAILGCLIQGDSNKTIARKMAIAERSEEHTSELQSRLHLVCRLLLEK